MISAELAPHILSSEALQIGLQENGYYCYEEDCDAAVVLRELWDKNILNADTYFAYYRVKSERPEAKDGYVTFNAANDSEKAMFLNRWNNSINESLEHWHPEYWKVYGEAERAVRNGKSKGFSRFNGRGRNTGNTKWQLHFLLRPLYG